MDRTYIESQQIVARYLSGDLTVREARQFEKYCLDNPDWVKTQPIPVRLKAKMIRKPGEELDANDLESMPSNTAIEAAQLDADEDDDDESTATGFGALQPVAQRWIKLLSVMLILAIAGVAGAIMYANSISKQLSTTQKTAKEYRLRAPGSTREYRVKPSEAKPNGPTVNIGWPESPQLIDLRINMSEGRYNTFLITITSLSEGHIMQIRRVARDTNGEVRYLCASIRRSLRDGVYGRQLESRRQDTEADRQNYYK